MPECYIWAVMVLLYTGSLEYYITKMVWIKYVFFIISISLVAQYLYDPVYSSLV